MTQAVPEWYVARNNQRLGPMPIESVLDMLRAGGAGPDDLVWRDGMPQWVPLRSVPELARGANFPPAAPGVLAYSGIDPNQGAQYAGFWLRFCAAFVDGLVLIIPQALIGCIFGAMMGARAAATGTPVARSGDDLLLQTVSQVFSIVIGWLYYAFMESSTRQATLGKMACGIIVTDTAGNRISFGRATGRHFAKFLSAIILLIGYIMAGFTEKKQALHDMIASTLVVRKPPGT